MVWWLSWATVEHIPSPLDTNMKPTALEIRRVQAQEELAQAMKELLDAMRRIEERLDQLEAAQKQPTKGKTQSKLDD